MNLFLTGTDTNVGKTYVAAMLIRALRKKGVDCAGFKPISCGDRADAEILHAACDGVVPLNDVNPVWFRAPAAPYAAAMVENRAVDLALVRKTFARLRATHAAVIVEGVGGWRVPLTAECDVAGLACEFALPVAVVVANRLGALNHTLLTLDSIRAHGLKCAGLIFNHVAPAGDDEQIAQATNRSILEHLGGVPVLYDIAHGQREIELV